MDAGDQDLQRFKERHIRPAGGVGRAGGSCWAGHACRAGHGGRQGRGPIFRNDIIGAARKQLSSTTYIVMLLHYLLYCENTSR